MFDRTASKTMCASLASRRSSFMESGYTKPAVVCEKLRTESRMCDIRGGHS